MTDTPFVGGDDQDPLDSGNPQSYPQVSEFPPAEQSLQAARKLVGPTTGKIKVTRRFVSVGIATWMVRGELRVKQGPDYEIELEGENLDEVSYALVDTLQTLGFEVGDQP